MTQTVPRLMSFPTERTEILLRFETGQAVGQARCSRPPPLDVGSILLAFGRKPGGVEKAFGLPPNYKLTWGHAIGYPLEDPKAGGQRPRIKFEKLFHKDAYGTPLPARPRGDEGAGGEGRHPGAGPAPAAASRRSRSSPRGSPASPGVVSWPEKEVKRLINDDGLGLRPEHQEARRGGPRAGRPAGLPRGDARDVQEAHGGARDRHEQVPERLAVSDRTVDSRPPSALRRRGPRRSAPVPAACGDDLGPVAVVVNQRSGSSRSRPSWPTTARCARCRARSRSAPGPEPSECWCRRRSGGARPARRAGVRRSRRGRTGCAAIERLRSA